MDGIAQCQRCKIELGPSTTIQIAGRRPARVCMGCYRLAKAFLGGVRLATEVNTLESVGGEPSPLSVDLGASKVIN